MYSEETRAALFLRWLLNIPADAARASLAPAIDTIEQNAELRVDI
jgi:hypothetical protein